MASCYAAFSRKAIPPVDHSLSRRKLIGTTSAGVAAAATQGSFVAPAQDEPRKSEMNYLAVGEGMEPAAMIRGFLIEQGVIKED